MEKVSYYMQMVTRREQLAILISDQINFKSNTVSRDKESHYMVIKDYSPGRCNSYMHLTAEHTII